MVVIALLCVIMSLSLKVKEDVVVKVSNLLFLSPSQALKGPLVENSSCISLLPPCNSCPNLIVNNQCFNCTMLLCSNFSIHVEKFIENLHARRQQRPSLYSACLASLTMYNPCNTLILWVLCNCL